MCLRAEDLSVFLCLKSANGNVCNYTRNNIILNV